MSWEAPYPAERLVPYDDVWPATAARLSADLLTSLGDGWEVEHVGSTSVPGLVAKPVVDLAVRVPAGWSAQRTAAALVGLASSGWSVPAEVGDHLALVLVEGGVRRAVAHMYRHDEWETAPLRLFADRLRRVRAEREAYAALKRRLVADGVWGASYTEAKGLFVHTVVARARAERGLPPGILPR